MMPRPQHEDVLGDILLAKDEPRDEKGAQVTNIIYAFFPNRLDPQNKKSADPEKISSRKTTHYLTQDVYGSLVDMQTSLPRQVCSTMLKKLSRSRIINKAVALIFEDFKLFGVDSQLAKALVEEEKGKALRGRK